MIWIIALSNVYRFAHQVRSQRRLYFSLGTPHQALTATFSYFAAWVEIALKDVSEYGL